MNSTLTRRWSRVGVVAAATLAFGGLTMSTSYAADDASIYVVQGIPGQNLDVEVDGDIAGRGREDGGRGRAFHGRRRLA